MKGDLFTKVLLSLIVVLLALNLVSNFFNAKPAMALPENSQTGKYQISSWAASIGTYGHHSGYFIVDTTTGKLFDSHEEAHDITKGITQ
jgi:hypothetical protein